MFKAPVCRHDEDVVVDENSNNQDYKTNRLKVLSSDFHICWQLHLAAKNIDNNSLLQIQMKLTTTNTDETHRYKYKVVLLLAEEGSIWHEEHNVDKDHLKSCHV